MSEVIVFNQIRSLREVITDSLSYFTQHFFPLLKAMLIFTLPFYLPLLALFAAVLNGAPRWLLLGAYPLGILLKTAFLLVIFSFMKYYLLHGSKPANLSELWAVMRRYAFRFAALVLLLFVAQGALSLIFMPAAVTVHPALAFVSLIPLAVISLLLVFAFQVLVIEDVQLLEACKRSIRLFGINWIQTIGLMAFFAIVVMLVYIAAVAPLSLLGHELGLTETRTAEAGPVFWGFLISCSLLFLVMPVFAYLFIIALGLQYFSLVEEEKLRREMPT